MSTYKTFSTNDSVSTRTLLHEAIPLTGSISSGSYSGNNIKNFSHGMFQSVYDYPYLSSSANHLYDITVGYSSDSHLSSSAFTQNAKKINVYNQMAQVLMGYDIDNNIQKFDQDGNIVAGGTKIKECFFIAFSRLLVKDEIKKGTFSMTMGIKGEYDNAGGVMEKKLTISDASGSNSFFSNSPTGEYGILYAEAATANFFADTKNYPVGLLFYQAGIAVISGSIFNDGNAAGNAGYGGILHMTNIDQTQLHPLRDNGGYDGFRGITGSTVTQTADAIRNRIFDLSFNNTIELNSSIYFCRASHNEFNFSSNPTYVSGSKIRVKGTQEDVPVTYITTVGLYDSSNQLLAVGKLSEPIRKDPSIELTFRARLDY